jgi:predicted dehydrogenase
LSIIKDGRIGKIVSIKASMCYKAPQEPNSRYFDPALGGGSLLDLGIYPIFLAHLLLGKPDTLKAVGSLSSKGVDEACSVLFHYNTGQQAILESSLLAQTDMPAEITGEKGTIKILDPWYEKSAGIELNLYNEEKIIYPCVWEGHGLQYETEEVLNCIQQGKLESDQMSHAFSLEMITIMDEIRNQIQVSYDMYE